METSLIKEKPELILGAIITQNYKYEQRSFQLKSQTKKTKQEPKPKNTKFTSNSLYGH